MSSEEQKQGRTVRESIQDAGQIKETVTDASGNVISEKMVDVVDGGAGKASGEAPPVAAGEPTDADLEVEAAKEGLIPASTEVEDEDEDEEEIDEDEES